MARNVILVLGLLGGCGFNPSGGDGGDDEPAAAGPGAVGIADPGPTSTTTLALNAPCTPTGVACAVGLTCRPRLAGPGLCRPVGEGDLGAPCEPEDDTCVAELACADGACVAVCLVADDRCAIGQACTPQWDVGVGFCR